MFRLFALIAAIGALVVGAMQLSAQAGSDGWQAFDEAEFMMAQGKGKTIVVAVQTERGAPAPVLEDLRKRHQDGATLFVQVDLETDAGFLDDHTLAPEPAVLVFKGKREVARSVAQTDQAALRSAVLSAL